MYLPTRLPALAALLLFSHLNSGRRAQTCLVPHRHGVNHADNVRAFNNCLHPAAMSNIWDYDCHGAVPESKMSGDSEDGDDDLALPDCLPPWGVRDVHFNCDGVLHCEIMVR